MKTQIAMTLSLLAIATLTLPARADAAAIMCDCMGDGVSWTVPADGADNVPTNAQIVVSWPVAATKLILIEAESGEPIPFQLNQLDTELFQLVPTQTLKPNTDVTVSAQDGRHSTFRVGSLQDDVAPILGAVSVDGAGEALCNDTVRTAVTVSGLADDTTESEALLVKLDIQSASGASTLLVRPDAMGWLRNASGCHNTVDGYQCTLQLGHDTQGGHCMNTFPAAEASTVHSITVTIVDAAGNESTPTEAVDFQFEHVPSAGAGRCNSDCQARRNSLFGGCTFASRGGTGGGPLGVIVLLLTMVALASWRSWLKSSCSERPAISQRAS